jgi:DMSO/TMAO reductase YedYZ molybdopterin-dependent catalytic subunit
MRRSPEINESANEIPVFGPRGITRRSLLISGAATIGAAGAAAYGWRYVEPMIYTGDSPGHGVIHGEPLALTSSGMLLDSDFPDPCAGGEYFGYLPFRSPEEDKFRGKVGQNSGGGHDARLCLDVASLLTPEGRLTPADQFFIRTEYPDLLRPPADWKIKVHGEVKEPQKISLKSLLPYVTSPRPVLLECSGNAAQLRFGLLSVAEWAGIPIEKIIQLAHPTEKAKAILVSGFDDDTHLPDTGPPYKEHSWPTCSWVFPIEQLVNAGAFLATEMNGAPLPKNHGAPARLLIPGWFGCTEVKWVNEIKFVDNTQKATWQMLEFSDRTNQQTHAPPPGFYPHRIGPPLARDYRPGTIDQNAIPVRVEQWKVGGKILYRVVGITWGGRDGRHRTEKLKIRFVTAGGRSEIEPVQFCKAISSKSEYGIWTHTFEAPKKGYCRIQVRLDDRTVPSRRLQSGTFDRGVFIPAI